MFRRSLFASRRCSDSCCNSPLHKRSLTARPPADGDPKVQFCANARTRFKCASREPSIAAPGNGIDGEIEIASLDTFSCQADLEILRSSLGSWLSPPLTHWVLVDRMDGLLPFRAGIGFFVALGIGRNARDTPAEASSIWSTHLLIFKRTV